MILVPECTEFRISRSSLIDPTIFTGLAALHSSPVLAGVGPQKRHTALPGGQKATLP